MGKVTEFFPDFGKYGEVLHRCVVVMAHLATLPGAPVQVTRGGAGAANGGKR